VIILNCLLLYYPLYTAIAVSNITNITAIKARILRNYSLGTKQFCIRFKNKINYTDFLLNISNIVLKAITKFISDEIQSL
jgi:hypothetical protein